MEEIISKKWMVREEELDDEQYKIKMMKMDDYLVEGCAGSGKTILALQKAKEIQDSDLGSYLVVIFTVTLKTFIQDGITNLGLDPDRVCNFHALEKNGFDSADYVIVDEIQDFSKEIIDKLTSMAKKNFIFFGDNAQQLYAKKNNNITLEKIRQQSDIKEKNYRVLAKNYRLPLPIAKFAESISTKEDHLANRCVKHSGEKPLIIKHNSPQSELDYFANLIKNETLSDVGILVENNAQVELVKNYFNSIGLECEFKYYTQNETKYKSRHNNIDFYTDKPKIMTYHSSKGLQFEHVFLPFCELDGNNHNYQEALYVAVTRASERLIITYSNSLTTYIRGIDRKYYDLQIR